MIIKKTLTNLKGMFHDCDILSNYDELKYLNTKEVTDFSDIFNNCSSISNIKPLEIGMFQKVDLFQIYFVFVKI